MSAAVFEDDYPTGPIDLTDPDVPAWMDQPRDRLGQFARKENVKVNKLYDGAVSVCAPAEGVNFHACRVVRVDGQVRVVYADEPAYRALRTVPIFAPKRGKR